MKYRPFAVVFASAAMAQAWPYDRCGGKGWDGPTACVDGYTCKFINDWYSQCIPGTGIPTASYSTTPLVTTSSTAPPSTTSVPAPGGGAGKLKWLGIDESAAEFGQGRYPGVCGTDFRFPDLDAIDTLIEQGYNIFRIPFAMERMVAPLVSSPLQTDYLNNITEVVQFITNRGKYAILDPHNYGRYNGNVMSDVSAFKTFWCNLAGRFRANAYVIFDTNNEFYDEDQTLVLQLNQAAIDGIRGAGATTQYIMAEGNSWSGAWTWSAVNDNLKALVDPENKLVYQMHQYLDADGSGTSADCVSSTIGEERLADATKWLRDNNKVGVLGEFAAGANEQCKAATTGFLDHLQANSDVWLGALWWGGGPWWDSYMFSFEPPHGTGYRYYNALLRGYIGLNGTYH